jgi:hypothetical protein
MLPAERSRNKMISERFWKKVDKNGPRMPHMKTRCWVWIGKSSGGRGRLDGVLASRIAFFLADGRWPIPCGLHKCDNRLCVRRSHLFEGTQSDNMHDMCRKGRNARGERSPHAKLTSDQVKEIRRRAGLGESRSRIARNFDVGRKHVGRIARGERWRWL